MTTMGSRLGPLLCGCLVVFCLGQLFLPQLAVRKDPRQLSFVDGLKSAGHRAQWTNLVVRAKKNAKKRARKRQEKACKEEARKQVTRQGPKAPKAHVVLLQLRQAESAKVLIDVLDTVFQANQFIPFYASRAYHALSRLNRRHLLHQSDWDNSVLQKLHSEVGEILRHGMLEQGVFISSASSILTSMAHLPMGMHAVARCCACSRAIGS